MKARNWYDLAKNDIQFCEVIEQQLLQEYAKAGLCFHIYQTVEKLMKGILLANRGTPQSTDIYNLWEMCEDFTDVELPAELEKILNTLTEWGNALETPKFDADIYLKEKAVIGSLTDILNNEIDKTETMIDKLEYVIGQKYAEKHNG